MKDQSMKKRPWQGVNWATGIAKIRPKGNFLYFQKWSPTPYLMQAAKDEEMVSYLTCPVCYQLFMKPKYLPCYHSYCEQCLEQTWQLEKKWQLQRQLEPKGILCPVCRKEVTVPPGGVKDFNDNFFATRLVDEFILKRKVEGEVEEKCEECVGEYPVMAYCPDCTVFLCQYCVEHHKCTSKSHIIVYKKKVNIQPTIMCLEHNMELLFYCETCDEQMCIYCAENYHISHSYTTVKDLVIKYKQELKKTTASIEEMIIGMADAHNNIEEMREKIRQQGDRLKNKIDLHYDEVIQKLMKQKEQLKRQTQDTMLRKENAIAAQLLKLECVQMEVFKMSSLNEGVEMKSDQEVISIKKQVIDHMEKITDKYNKICFPSVQDTMEFVPNEDILPQLGLLCSAAEPDPCNCEVVDLPKYFIKGKKVEVTIITKDGDYDRCSGGSAVSIRLEGAGNTMQVRDNDDGSYVASFVPQQIGKLKMSVFINEQQIKGSPYSVVVNDYTSLNKPSKLVNDDGDMGRPWGIAFSKNGMWAVSDWSNHLVYIFDDEDRLVTMFGGYGSYNSQFYHPEGVTFDSNGCLFVVDSANHRVQKFTPEMKYLLKFGSKGSRDMELEYPNGLAVHNGKVYISDRDNKRISVFETDGIFHRTVGSGVLDRPYDVTVTNDNQLLIADRDHQCIYRFTLDGHYIGKFGTELDNGELYNPSGITVDLYGIIFVTDTGKHCVSIYNKDGVFMHSFGSSVSAADQFEPYGIGVAVSANGHVYVSDHNNERIQIFPN